MTHAARKTNNAELDQYWTPAWPVRLLVDQWGGVSPDDRIAEPCCGKGDMCMALTEAGYTDVKAADIQPQGRIEHWLHANQVDARTDGARRLFCDEHDCDATVTNPPYSGEAGSAGEVMESVVSWGLPTAALLRITWLEPCQDRQWAWCADPTDPMRPTRVWVLPRVEYEYPGDQPGNPATSVWVVWEPGRRPEVEGTSVRHFGPAAEDRYRGQRSLLEVAE